MMIRSKTSAKGGLQTAFAALAIVFLTLVCLGLYLRVYSLEIVSSFQFAVYPSMSEAEVIRAVGKPSRVVKQGEPVTRLGSGYYPDPKLPNRNKIFVYYRLCYRFCVYFDRRNRVICVVTGKT